MESIQLQHPTGKKAISMAATKYEPMKVSILHSLASGPKTHNQLLQAVNAYFADKKMEFTGAINWHMEWVKLDLEARMIIRKVGSKAPFEYEMNP